MNEEIITDALSICIEMQKRGLQSAVLLLDGTDSESVYEKYKIFYKYPLTPQYFERVKMALVSTQPFSNEHNNPIKDKVSYAKFKGSIIDNGIVNKILDKQANPQGIRFITFYPNEIDKFIGKQLQKIFGEDTNQLQITLLDAVPDNGKTKVHRKMVKALINPTKNTYNYNLAKCLESRLTTAKYKEASYKKKMQEKIKSRIDVINKYINAIGYTVHFSRKNDRSYISKINIPSKT